MDDAKDLRIVVHDKRPDVSPQGGLEHHRGKSGHVWRSEALKVSCQRILACFEQSRRRCLWGRERLKQIRRPTYEAVINSRERILYVPLVLPKTRRELRLRPAAAREIREGF